MRVRSLGDTAIAPDGREVLYVVVEAQLSENRYLPNIWSVPVNGGAAVQLTQGGANAPRWAPDGRHVAFLVPDKNGSQLWLMRPDGSEAHALLAEGRDLEGFEWSPEGTRIAFLEVDSSPTPSTTAVVADQAAITVNLHTVTLQDKREAQLTHGKFVISEFSWAPDGKEIAFSRRPSLHTIDDYNTDISAVRLSDGAIRDIVTRPGRDDDPKFSPDGQSIAFTSTNGSTREYANVDVFVVPARGGTPRDVTPRLGERLYGFYGWSADGRSVFFRARRGVTMQLFRASVTTAEVEAVTNGDFVYDAFSFTRVRPYRMAFLRTDATTPKQLFFSSSDPFQAHPLVDPNPNSGSLRIGRTKSVHWKADDGTAIEGLLAMPAAGSQAGRAPVLVILHGGPSGAFTIGFAPQISAVAVPVGLDACPAPIFTERGYAVFMPNIRGSGGYGETFRKKNISDWGGADLGDVMSGLKALAADPLLDLQRTGVLGWSYGGFLTAWAIANSNRFSAAVVGAGPTDLWSWYGTTDQPDQAEAYFGGTPWQHPQLYAERSTIRVANRIRTPTLILHGELDEAVPLNQAQQLYRALQRNGVPVQLVSYPGSGHDPTQPQQNLDVWKRTLDWVNQWLPANAAP